MSTKLWNRLDKEAVELWKRPLAEVRQALIVHYMPFAEQLASKKSARNRRVDPDDVRSKAYEALVCAVDAFKPDNEKGATFTTFAGWRIRGQTVEAERENDWVSHKVRAEHGDTLPKMGHFADEHTGKRRAENMVPDRERDETDDKPDLAAEMAKWPDDVREIVELLLASGWDVEQFVERIYGPDSNVSEELLMRCGNPRLAVKLLRSTLKSIGAETAVSTFGVKEMPPVELECAA